MLPPALMQTQLQGQPVAAQERRLLRIYRTLESDSQETLLAFAEFLAQRNDAGPSAAERVAVAEPVPEPRPAQETVIAAIKRLRRSYPMLDSGTMLQETSQLMAAHVLQGREAAAVVDELEALFAARYEALKGGGKTTETGAERS
ncbi:hypothetical protein [Thiohalocapsa halophila]|nr:hypothetical protein [Thiohalocapsa halophila]